ncbi:type II toxin-antitoxin system VapC family toxin [Candidatus Woesearchaeota archaeon]|nr:type II toxin-antitoxin system VapC family toxin [Candidatus Woesearchaeota archaeon]
MEKQKKVIDASVAVKWFANEPGSDAALALRNEHISGEAVLIVPDIFFAEVVNAMRYKEKDEEKLMAANNAIWDLQLHSEKTTRFVIEKAISLALEHNLSLYDAAYAAIAQTFGAQLVTADKSLGKLPNVTLL